MAEESKVNDKLRLWQDRLGQSNSAFSDEVDRMEERERIYNGTHSMKPLVDGHRRDPNSKTSHVRNIVFENIESEVSSSVPMPKVTARRQKDEHLAQVIEHYLRNEIDRMPFEAMNDMQERTVPIQGGAFYLVEWDNTECTHSTVGENKVSVIHPKQIAPQPGVYTSIDDMDWIIIKLPTTKANIRRKYGISVEDESEAEPSVRSSEADTASDEVTQYIGFEKNDDGGIDRYVWVNDTELEDLENYQARRQPVCKNCGRVRPLPGQIISAEREMKPFSPLTGNPFAEDETMAAGRDIAAAMAQAQYEDPDADMTAVIELEPGEAPDNRPNVYEGGPCPWCGADDWTTQEQEFEEIMLPMVTASGLEIPGMTPGYNEMGVAVMQPTLVPFYRPNKYPIIMQRNVSVYGQLLGNSDVDAIADQQNTLNRIEQKIIDRLMKAGTRITLPDRADLRVDPEDSERWYLKNASDKSMIGTYDFTGNLQYEMAYLSNVYEEARQVLGITNSFQGRQDSTATSGVAKQFAAAQSAGRLESKRIMKNAAYADLFELMFKFALAYGDEPRTVTFTDNKGNMMYEEFNRYDFLEQDESGTYYWNDQFLFSVDTSDTLANNRANMWTETRNNLQTGAFGDPSRTDTLILFWAKMEELHYPGAAQTKKFLEDRYEQEQQQAAMAQQLAAAQAQAQGNQGAGLQQAAPAM